MVQDKNYNSTPDKASAINTGDIPSDEKRKKVGNYVILKTIGEGSFAKVRLGVHLITEMKVAVKVINKREVFKRNYLRANLRREASMMQRMCHPNIVELHEVMETENSYYIVMDLVEGTEFVKYLTKRRQLDENETKKYIRQIVSAVDHMHRAHVIHRDIKLQNFMLDENNDIIIIDFGLSNCLDEKGFLTTQCGSPAYAAPEIFAHQEYGSAVDIWSIGVNMYAMLVGKLPFKVEHRSRNLAKLHACILKGCEIPNTLSRDCQDLLSRLLEPSPTKRISMQEILRHPFLVQQLGPIELTPFKPQSDAKEINRNVIRYLSFKHGYSETEIEEAVLHRKPIAARAIYTLIERRLQEGLGWPDRTYNNSGTGISSTTATGGTMNDGLSDMILLDKLERQEPLLPGRRTLNRQVSANNPNKLVREKSNYISDDHLFVRGNTGGSSITAGLTQEALNELVPASRLASTKLYHDIVLRKSSGVGGGPTSESPDEHPTVTTRRTVHSNTLVPIRTVTTKRGNVLIVQQKPTLKPRSLPNSTLDHANQNALHLPHDPYAVSRASKNTSRTSNIDYPRKAQQTSPMRYAAAPSVTIKSIGLFLKNSALHSRISSSSSKSSKSTGGNVLEVQQASPPLKFYPTTKSPLANYHSQGNLTTTTTADRKKSGFMKTSSSQTKVQRTSTTNTGQKLMPT